MSEDVAKHSVLAPTGPRYRPDIDGLRAVAVAAVVMYHAFPRLVPGGFVGVDIFFVISGYLITQLILAGLAIGRFSIVEFYRRRLRRIVPALLVVVLVSGAFGWFALLPGEFTRFGDSVGWSAAFLANAFFKVNNDYFGPAADLAPMLHLWSLAVEEQFYLLWPALVLLAFRQGLVKQTLIAVVVTSLAISISAMWLVRPDYFYLLGPRAWELAVGGLLAASTLRTGTAPSDTVAPRSGWLPRAASILGGVLACVSIFLLRSGVTYPGAWAMLPTGAAIMLIGAGPLAPVNRSVLSSRPMVFLGKISYPLYLWHWPLLSFAGIILGKPPAPGLAAILVLTAVAAAYATYMLVERPIRFGASGRRAAPALLTGLAALVLAGVAVRAGWLPARLSNPAFSQWGAAVGDWDDRYTLEPDGSWRATLPSRRGQMALFVGDSHIQQYSARIARVIEDHPDAARAAMFVTYYGCPPVPNVNSSREGSSCNTMFEHAMEQALLPNVDTVVFGAYWEAYLLGEFASDGRRRSVDYAYNIHNPTPAPLWIDTSGRQEALEDFQRVVANLVARGRKVFIVLSNSTSLTFDPLILIPASARLTIPSPQSIGVERSRRSVDATQFKSYVAPVIRRLREIAKQTGARIIDPAASLCDGTACPSMDAEGVPTHMDSNHITASFARQRAAFIDDILLAGASD
ncbi:MAG TPA: acyltransferase family protein [Steroidobacteraceae bacterium]